MVKFNELSESTLKPKKKLNFFHIINKDKGSMGTVVNQTLLASLEIMLTVPSKPEIDDIFLVVNRHDRELI